MYHFEEYEREIIPFLQSTFHELTFSYSIPFKLIYDCVLEYNFSMSDLLEMEKHAKDQKTYCFADIENEKIKIYKRVQHIAAQLTAHVDKLEDTRNELEKPKIYDGVAPEVQLRIYEKMIPYIKGTSFDDVYKIFSDRMFDRRAVYKALTVDIGHERKGLTFSEFVLITMLCVSVYSQSISFLNTPLETVAHRRRAKRLFQQIAPSVFSKKLFSSFAITYFDVLYNKIASKNNEITEDILRYVLPEPYRYRKDINRALSSVEKKYPYKLGEDLSREDLEKTLEWQLSGHKLHMILDIIKLAEMIVQKIIPLDIQEDTLKEQSIDILPYILRSDELEAAYKKEYDLIVKRQGEILFDCETYKTACWLARVITCFIQISLEESCELLRVLPEAEIIKDERIFTYLQKNNTL